MNNSIKQLLKYYGEYQDDLYDQEKDKTPSHPIWLEPTFEGFMYWLSEKVDQPNNTKAV